MSELIKIRKAIQGLKTDKLEKALNISLPLLCKVEIWGELMKRKHPKSAMYRELIHEANVKLLNGVDLVGKKENTWNIFSNNN